MTINLERPTRLFPHRPSPRTIKLPTPPSQNTNALQALLQLGLPALSMVSYTLVSLSGQNSQRSLLPIGISVIATTGLGFTNYLRKRHQLNEQKAHYGRQLRQSRDEWLNSEEEERHYLKTIHPDVTTLCQIAGGKTLNRSGSRLYERRNYHSDFAELRLGITTLPCPVTCVIPDNVPVSDLSLSEALRLVEDSQYIHDVPTTISLSSRQVEGDNARHVLGIAGTASVVEGHLRAILMSYAGLHAPHEASLWTIGTENNQFHWQWLRILPHIHIETGEENWAFSNTEIDQQLKRIQKILNQRKNRLKERDVLDIRQPFLLLVVDATGSHGKNLLQHVKQHPALRLIYENGLQLGAAVIFAAETRPELPSECTAISELVEIQQTITLLYAEASMNGHQIVGLADTASLREAEECFALQLARYEVPKTRMTGLPRSINFLEIQDAY